MSLLARPCDLLCQPLAFPHGDSLTLTLVLDSNEQCLGKRPSKNFKAETDEQNFYGFFVTQMFSASKPIFRTLTRRHNLTSSKTATVLEESGRLAVGIPAPRKCLYRTIQCCLDQQWGTQSKEYLRPRVWCKPLLPDLRRQRVRALRVQDQPGLQSDLQESHSSINRPCLKKKKTHFPSF